MNRHPAFGLSLALFGALVITPDTLLMRWSGMDGMHMATWRGLLMGMVFVLVWVLLRRRAWRVDLRHLLSMSGLTVVVCQYIGSILFNIGIAEAPVSVVLFSIASVPVFSAGFALILMGERSHWSTWAAMAAVAAGIGIAVFGNGSDATANGGNSVLGAVAGLAVAVSLALNFVSIRRDPMVPVPLAVGCGALLSGLTALALIGPAAAMRGNMIDIALSGAVVLPLSFFALAAALRYTPAVNVSLLMLVETVLGPFWVWLGTGQKPTEAMMLGGAIVVGSLMLYLTYSGRQQTLPRVVQPSVESA